MEISKILSDRMDRIENKVDDNHKEVMSEIKDLGKSIKEGYVSKSEFKLVRVIVFGLCGSILMYVLNQLLSLV